MPQGLKPLYLGAVERPKAKALGYPEADSIALRYMDKLLAWLFSGSERERIGS
jgi:hypothetical protein